MALVFVVVQLFLIWGLTVWVFAIGCSFLRIGGCVGLLVLIRIARLMRDVGMGLDVEMACQGTYFIYSFGLTFNIVALWKERIVY